MYDFSCPTSNSGRGGRCKDGEGGSKECLGGGGTNSMDLLENDEEYMAFSTLIWYG